MFPEETRIWIRRRGKEDHPHQCKWASSKPSRHWIEQKHGGRANLLSTWGGILSTPALEHWCVWFLGLWPQTRIYIIGLLVLRPWTVTYTICFPGPPACKQHIMGHLILLNCVSQSLIINLFLRISLFILLVLSLWKSLTNTVGKWIFKSGTEKFDV